MHLRFAIAALVCATAAGAGAQPVVLADGRSEGAPASEWSGGAAFRQAVDAASTYWRGRSTDYEEDIQVMDVAEGGFTEAGATQQAVLYLMSPWPRCCPKMGIALIENDRLLLNLAFEQGEQTLDAVPDLNGDGRNEIVFTGGFGMGGQVTRSMMLTTFGPSGIEDLMGDLIYDSSCGAGAGGGVSHASRVLASPGPALTIERFTQPCDGGEWVPAGAAEPVSDDPMLDFRYVEIPLSRPVTAVPDQVAVGRRESGRLEPGDRTLNSGEYVDQYDVQCRRGQTLIVDLHATDFDPYLIVRPPAGEQIDNDDHEGDRTHSHVEAAPAQDGTCEVLVTSYQPGESGAYELTIGE